jgi:hypothetical protein
VVKTLLDNEKQLLFYTKKQTNTSQCDLGNVTFVIFVIRISLFKGDRRFCGKSAMQGLIVASQETL